MKALTRDQMTALDRLAIEEGGIAAETLMEHAGAGVAQAAEKMIHAAAPAARRCTLVAGKGNNGGDAFVAARRLQELGVKANVVLTVLADSIQGASAHHFNLMLDTGVEVMELARESDWKSLPPEHDAHLVVDGILGTGLQGAAKGVAARAIERVNYWGQRCPVVAIDIPSGLNADSGVAEGPAVRADLTVTMGYPKQGLLNPRAFDHVGNVDVVDIGIPPGYCEPLNAELEMIARTDLIPLVPRRPRAVHKGTFGHVLIVAGSRGMSGAAGLAARAALRSGAGLVSVLTPASVASIVAAMAPEAMVHGGCETRSGALAGASLSESGLDPDAFDSIMIGPGLATDADQQELVAQILRGCTTPIVLDADALSICAGESDILRKARGPIAITPHPGEMARLLGCSPAAVQADRPGSAWQAERELDAVVVLKGAGTLVCRRGSKTHINMTGNAGMACGGMGDALSGLLGGLLAQGLKPFDGARLAVWLHGRAGDHAARRATEPGMTATDLTEALPAAWKELGKQS